MLTLMLLRHATAAQHMPDGDFARALTQRGAADAAALGGYLARSNLIPDLAYVSSSIRTLQTFELIGRALGTAPPCSSDRGLYNATAGELRDRLRDVAPAVRTLLIVGHNPGIMDVAVALARDGDPAEIERMRGRFPPCGLAILTFDTQDWRDAKSSGGRLDLFLAPDDLASAR